MIKVELGDEVKDGISGFKGIATGRAEYMTGCVQIQIATGSQNPGQGPIDCWIDEQRLIVMKSDAYRFPEKAIEEAPAGPQNVPPARHP